MSVSDLQLGHDRVDAEPISLNPLVLLRHMLALGSSGSGKTVLSKVVVEEMVRQGVPAICVDPQGDLCSLALRGDAAEWAGHGVDPELAEQFAERADVVVFTPAASQGVPLIADPLQMDLSGFEPAERVQAVTGMATQLTALLGYDLDSDDGEGLIAVFDRALTQLWDGRAWPGSVAAFADWFVALGEDELAGLARYLDRRRIAKAAQKLARLDVGARRQLFHGGLPLAIDTLLGRDGRMPVPAGKTRLAIIYLNSLHTQEDKAFLIAALAERLYGWMLRRPSKQPQLLFYIDEVAPFIPPVRKPASKPALGLVFKQARKYGVCCLMATQNPGDLDYKAMAQFGTWALGRMTLRQDIKKIAPSVQGLDPMGAEAVLDALPAQNAGEFVLISPDAFSRSHALASRWLYSAHRTLDEEAIADLAHDLAWEQRYELVDARVFSVGGPEEAGPDGEPQAGQVLPSESASKPSKARKPRTKSTQVQPKPDLSDWLAKLASRPSMTAADFAQAASLSESKARRVLQDLLETGMAERFKRGRGHHYWTRQSGYRPDLDIVQDVQAFDPLIDRQAAEKLAVEEHLEGPWMGVLGFDERLEGVELVYRLVLRLVFTEKVRRNALARLFGPSHEEHHDSLYLHPIDLRFVMFHPRRGIRLQAELDHELASGVQDFDGVAQIGSRRPADLDFEAIEWRQRRADQEVIQRFQQRFEARAERVEPVFLPTWRLKYSAEGRGSIRVIAIDALAGKPLEW